VPDVADLVVVGRAQGLDAMGVTTADPFTSTRRHLDERKADGLHGGMGFTYLDPARSTDPRTALPDAKTLIVAARSYLRARPRSAGEHGEGTRPRPTAQVARYAWTDHYRPLRAALFAVGRELKAHGWRARVLADDNALVDRAAAQRAGLGWFGKNANVLLPGQGSFFVLGALLTDAPLDAPPPEPAADGCGTCTRCIDDCPTGAIVAPGVVDARRCLAWLLQVEGPFPAEHRVALGDRIYGCDDCQEVCPPNRRQVRLRSAAPHDVDEQQEDDEQHEDEGLVAEVDVLAMLAAADDELLDRHGRWYVPHRQARYLRRNALVVLGNVGDPGDPAVVSALDRALADDDPLIRSHAVWAARRLGRDDRLAAVVSDDDALVRHELAAPVEVRP
jgi:epoxyqueuosine reductase